MKGIKIFKSNIKLPDDRLLNLFKNNFLQNDSNVYNSMDYMCKEDIKVLII